MSNWEEIKTEYITTDISYRALAQKHGVYLNTLAARAKAEGWVELRKRHRDSIVTKALRYDANMQAKRLANFQRSADRLLERVNRAIDELDTFTYKKKETLKSEDGEVTTESTVIDAEQYSVVDRAGVRQLAAAMRDLKECMMLRSEQEERELDLKNQLKERELGQKGPKELHVVLEGCMEDYAN